MINGCASAQEEMLQFIKRAGRGGLEHSKSEGLGDRRGGFIEHGVGARDLCPTCFGVWVNAGSRFDEAQAG